MAKKQLKVIKEHKVMTENKNIVKKVCSDLGITQKELAEKLDVPPTTVSGWANGDIPKMTKFALELYVENIQLNNKLKVFKEAHKIASEI